VQQKKLSKIGEPVIRRIPGLLVLIGVAGCAAFSRANFQDPQIELNSIAVRGIGLTGGTLDLMLDVTNPNSFDIKGTRIEVGLDVEGTHFGDVVLDDAFNLPQGQPTRVVIPLTFNWAGVGAAARSALSYGTVKYEMEGKAGIQTPWGVEQVPFKREGSVALNGQRSGSATGNNQ
jgi:LEA14-like dessication related protein